MLLGMVLLALLFRVTVDLMSHRSTIKWFLGKKKVQELQDLTPAQFENYIEELFRSLGYNTKTVGGRSDGGVDGGNSTASAVESI